MRTPYDTALRQGERGLDVLRREITRVGREDQALAHGAHALTCRLAQARTQQIADPLLDSSRFVARASAERRAIEHRRGKVAAKMGELRDSAGQAVAELQALRQLAMTHRLAETRRAAAAEQRAIDDRFASLRSTR